MTKIIVSMASLSAGGAARVLSVLSSSLADNFDEVHYVMWNEGKIFYPIDSRVKLVSLNNISKSKKRIKHIIEFRKYVKCENPDLILSFLTPFNMLVLTSTIGISKKIIVAERTDPKRILSGGRIMLKIRNLLYKRANGILTQTEYAKRCYDEKFDGKTKVIYNPITMSEEQVGRSLQTPSKKLMITVGRLEAVKDQSMMIDAFADFYKTHKDYRLEIFGEGPMRPKLETQIDRLGLQNCVSLCGHTRGVWDKMVDAECFLLTSLAEGMSNALIEAMCLGLPVISTKVSGSTDLIKDGENGLLIDIGDKEALLNRMYLLAGDPSLRERMGKEATKVYEQLREEKICKEWIEYLRLIINKN